MDIGLSFPVDNSKKTQPEAQITGVKENGAKQVPLVTRSLPRRCLSMEGATSNYRSNLSPPLRPSPIYLDMENPRRSYAPKSRRYRSNYPVGKYFFLYVNLYNVQSTSYNLYEIFLSFLKARSYRRDTLPAELLSPSGFPVHRQTFVDDFDSDYDYYGNDDQDRQPLKPVPIWLCVFLVVSYIFGGAFLFSAWEHWPFLDSAYFCFITLTTIGQYDI